MTALEIHEHLSRTARWITENANAIHSFAEEAGPNRQCTDECHCGYQLGHDGPCQEDE